MLLGALLASSGGHVARAASLYSNQNYFYAIRFPDGLVPQTSRPPAPNHGFALALGSGRYIMVDGSHDAAFWGSASAALQKYREYAGLPPGLPERGFHLAGLPAARLSACVHGRCFEIVTAYRRSDATGDAIIYTLLLQSDAPHERQDSVVLTKLMEGFRLEAMK